MEAARWNRPKIRLTSSAGIPIPWSWTASRTRSCSTSSFTLTGLPAPYFTALESTLTRTCSIRRRSQEPSAFSGSCSSSGALACAAGSRKLSATWRTRTARSNSSSHRSRRPWAIRETSSRRSMSRERRSVCRTAPSSLWNLLGSAAARPCSRPCSFSCNAVSGVRSSCAATEMNSSRSRSAASACSLRPRSSTVRRSASRSCSSIRARAIAAAITFATASRKLRSLAVNGRFGIAASTP